MNGPRTVKYRAWIPALQVMRPVARIHMGDEGGEAKTVTFVTAPVGDYYEGFVHGENGLLLPHIGLQDRHGVDIYEHDLIDAWSAGSHCVGICKWGTVGFFILCPIHPCIWHFSGPQESCEVVGNIYEQPELVPPYLREQYNIGGWIPPLPGAW